MKDRAKYRALSDPTLADVARLAGVSTSTASRALAGVKGIAPQTVDQVIKAAKKLGYPLKPPRDNLENAATLLGVIVANTASPFYSALIQAIEDAALQHGFSIILCNSNYQTRRERHYLQILIEKGVQGIILTPIETEEPFVYKLLERNIPIVQVDRYIEKLRCDVVTSDNFLGAYKAVEFLFRQGYKRVAIISGPREHSTGRDRLEGYLQAVRDAGQPAEEGLIRIGDFKKGSAYRLTRELLEGPLPPEALFVANLDMTIGALTAIRDLGRVIPDDVGIIGFDEFEAASLLDPPLTTVEQQIDMMGAMAVDLLVRRIGSQQIHYEPVTLKLETRLIVRHSTRPQAR